MANVMHLLFSLLRIIGLYMVHTLLAHRQEEIQCCNIIIIFLYVLFVA
jgi:hypothetical protein